MPAACRRLMPEHETPAPAPAAAKAKACTECGEPATLRVDLMAPGLVPHFNTPFVRSEFVCDEHRKAWNSWKGWTETFPLRPA